MKLCLQITLYALLLDILTSDNVHSNNRTVCDNGIYKIEEDINRVDGHCNEEDIVISEFLYPAGVTHCEEDTHGQPQCMIHAIHYSSTPPTNGDYRHVPPMYGEYRYLPPQRWLHSLIYGAIGFLYHPCAPVDQIITFKAVATQCIRKHIISTYPYLSKDKPFALVSWGCVCSLAWVDTDFIKNWIKTHALRTPESFITQDGTYNYSLLESAITVSTYDDSIICPLDAIVTIQTVNNTTTVDNTTTDTVLVTPSVTALTGNCSSNDCQIKYVIFVYQHPLLTSLFIISLIVFVLLGSVWLLCYCKRKQAILKQKKQMGRYKCISHFFPTKDNVIAIPEIGIPKAMPSEREKLLIESDEDEL